MLSLAASVPLLALLPLPFWRFWDAASLRMLIGLACTRRLPDERVLRRPSLAGRGGAAPDEQGDWQQRIPTQLLEAGWAVLVLTGASLARPAAPFAGASSSASSRPTERDAWCWNPRGRPPVRAPRARTSPSSRR